MKALKTLTLRSALAVAMAALCFGTTAAAAQEIKARFGTFLPDSHPQTLGARKFAELVEQTAQVYIGAYEAITGQPFEPDLTGPSVLERVRQNLRPYFR